MFLKALYPGCENRVFMQLNPDKFQVILLEKRGADNTNIEVKIGNEKIKSTSSVNFLEFILTIN